LQQSRFNAIGRTHRNMWTSTAWVTHHRFCKIDVFIVPSVHLLQFRCNDPFCCQLGRSSDLVVGSIQLFFPPFLFWKIALLSRVSTGSGTCTGARVVTQVCIYQTIMSTDHCSKNSEIVSILPIIQCKFAASSCQTVYAILLRYLPKIGHFGGSCVIKP
jgi:hypothetical protein